MKRMNETLCKVTLYKVTRKSRVKSFLIYITKLNTIYEDIFETLLKGRLLTLPVSETVAKCSLNTVRPRLLKSKCKWIIKFSFEGLPLDDHNP